MADFNVKIQIICKMALLLNFAKGNINNSIHIIMLYDFFTYTNGLQSCEFSMSFYNALEDVKSEQGATLKCIVLKVCCLYSIIAYFTLLNTWKNELFDQFCVRVCVCLSLKKL